MCLFYAQPQIVKTKRKKKTYCTSPLTWKTVHEQCCDTATLTPRPTAIWPSATTDSLLVTPHRCGLVTRQMRIRPSYLLAVVLLSLQGVTLMVVTLINFFHNQKFPKFSRNKSFLSLGRPLLPDWHKERLVGYYQFIMQVIKISGLRWGGTKSRSLGFNCARFAWRSKK